MDGFRCVGLHGSIVLGVWEISLESGVYKGYYKGYSKDLV